MDDVFGFVLAGGKGTRLRPLTRDRAKPAVPFGGVYRIIDPVITSLDDANLREIAVLTQFHPRSLTRHISKWPHKTGHRLYTIGPRETLHGKSWYNGTAHAIQCNLDLIEFDARDIAVFSGDHIYTIDANDMLKRHRETQADFTIAAKRVPISDENFDGDYFKYGVLTVDSSGRVIGFKEKPEDPAHIPDEEGFALASMGNYLIKRSVLDESLKYGFDFGNDIIPKVIENKNVMAYTFNDYWEDVGGLKAYFKANMDLISENPGLDLYKLWESGRPIRNGDGEVPPTIDDNKGVRNLVSDGFRSFGSDISNSIISPHVRVYGSKLEDAIVFSNVRIGQGSELKRVIIDKNNIIPPNSRIGYDPDADRARGYHVDPESGIVVVPRGNPGEYFEKLRELKKVA